jgi:hypothetical protein
VWFPALQAAQRLEGGTTFKVWTLPEG